MLPLFTEFRRLARVQSYARENENLVGLLKYVPCFLVVVVILIYAHILSLERYRRLEIIDLSLETAEGWYAVAHHFDLFHRHFALLR